MDCWSESIRVSQRIVLKTEITRGRVKVQVVSLISLKPLIILADREFFSSCSKTEIPWECSVDVLRKPESRKVEITARRVGRTGIIYVKGLSDICLQRETKLTRIAPIDIVPHTETGSEGDRDFTVTFLEKVEVSLQNDEKEWRLHDCPDYLFQEKAG